jgi:hypothetical protein
VIEFDYSMTCTELMEFLCDCSADTPEGSISFNKMRTALTPEQLQLVFDYINNNQVKEFSIGAKQMLKGLRREGLLLHGIDGTFDRRLHSLREENQSLRLRVAELEALNPSPIAPESAWEPEVVVRSEADDEMALRQGENQWEIQATANAIEALVEMRGGRVAKSDVKAALSGYPLYARGLRHSMLSGKIHATGSELRTAR